MFLGSVLVDRTIEGVAVKKKALVVAFEQVVKRVVDKKAGLFKTAEEAHYEASLNQTRLVLATYRGENAVSYSAQDSVDVPLSFEQVDALLAASAKSGEAVDLQRLQAPPEKDSLAQKVLEVGGRLRDGTVVIAVDLKNNKALFAPAGIFGGEATFDSQHKIPAQLNKDKTRNHGHDDWRNITDDEGKTLSEVWDKVAPDGLKGRAAPWFWLDSPGYDDHGRAGRGGVAGGVCYGARDCSLPVPVVRFGPAVG